MNAREDWRVDLNEKDIKRLDKRLYEAEDKIRELERRPMEWLFKVEMWVLWALVGALWVLVIIEAASKHD